MSIENIIHSYIFSKAGFFQLIIRGALYFLRCLHGKYAEWEGRDTPAGQNKIIF